MEVEKILSNPSLLPDNDAMLMGKQYYINCQPLYKYEFLYDNMALPVITETEEERYNYY